MKNTIYKYDIVNNKWYNTNIILPISCMQLSVVFDKKTDNIILIGGKIKAHRVDIDNVYELNNIWIINCNKFGIIYLNINNISKILNNWIRLLFKDNIKWISLFNRIICKYLDD